MHRFVIHTTDTAPEKATPMLEKIEDDLGYVPNLFGGLADAPAVLDAYLSLDKRFRNTELTPLQRNIVLLSASRANECEYCMAAHSKELSEAGFPADEIERVRSAEPLSDDRLEALRLFTHRIVERRGHPTDEHIADFLEAGFERPQVLEVVLGVAMKTLSNYTNHIMDTPLDEPIADFAWSGETRESKRQPATTSA
jgi:uncharacterized peroxidase-related enzyme